MATVKPLYMGTDFEPTEMATTDDLVIGGLSSSGNILLTGGAEVTGLPNTPGSGDAATSKNYVDGLFNGVDWKESVRVATAATLTGWTTSGSGIGKTLTSPTDATSNNDFDGVTVAVNDRILVKDGPSNVDNGIYVMTTLADGAGQNAILTRATDADEDAEVTNGLTTFVGEGTANADKQYTLITDDPITVDTTGQDYSLTNTNALVGGDGIDITSGTVSVDLAPISGLEFASGQLRVDVANTAELSIDANGLNVEGLPSLFQINGVATTAGVTAANLNTLTDGSNADALHFHTASSSDQVLVTLTADAAITKGDPVYFSANDQVTPADNATQTARRVFGVANETVADTNPVDIVTQGEVDGVLTATAGDFVFLDTTSGLTTTRPTASGSHVVLIGFAMTSADLWVHIQYIAKNA